MDLMFWETFLSIATLMTFLGAFSVGLVMWIVKQFKSNNDSSFDNEKEINN